VGKEREELMKTVNYKLAGSGGFSPHIDSTAYTHVKNIKHLTILLAVDDSNMSNGGLEVVEGSHLMDVPIDHSDNCLEKEWVDRQTWVPVELEAGTFNSQTLSHNLHN
jgi:ectoine hydroxylase-related dioxygenase (phytanoyl-CoA dioxygenase family)